MPVSAVHYMHPLDRTARERLEAVPLFQQAVKVWLKIYNERQFHAVKMADNVRLGPNQLPEIYGLFPPICERLGVEEPEFYLEQNPYPNAYAFGDTRTFVTITSGALDLWDEDELRSVLGHEVGHIACRHTLYRSMVIILLNVGNVAGLGPFLEVLSKPILLALLYWFRRSELSADRAAALLDGGPQKVIETHMRLSGGPKSLTAKINQEVFLQQASEFEQLLESDWDNLLVGLRAMERSHPFPVARALEIRKWCKTQTFRNLVARLDSREVGRQCKSCGADLRENWRFCASCGASIAAMAQRLR